MMVPIHALQWYRFADTVISWIKDKYYDISFQKAKTLIAEGDTDEAIRVLESILEKHPNAPQTLLEVYHSMILRGNKSESTLKRDIF
ncbi:MAG: tetratricopeptide repeat protein, partial [Segatella copri]